MKNMETLLHTRNVVFDSYENTETGERSLDIDLPGVKKENLSIKFEGEAIQIRAKRPAPEADTKIRPLCNLRWKERNITIPVPDQLDPSTLKAHYENGVLNLSIQVREDAKPKDIPIQFA